MMDLAISKIKEATGWEPRIPLEQTIDEVLADWRRKEAENGEAV